GQYELLNEPMSFCSGSAVCPSRIRDSAVAFGPNKREEAMTPPETRYAKSGDIRIAYQVVGKGPFDLVFVLGFVSNLDLIWEDADWAHFFSRLASFSRLIVFDK